MAFHTVLQLNMTCDTNAVCASWQASLWLITFASDHHCHLSAWSTMLENAFFLQTLFIGAAIKDDVCMYEGSTHYPF